MATAKKKRSRRRTPKQRQIMLEYSKRITNDMRGLLWVISVGGLLLGFYAVHERFEGALPWISAMVGLPWTAWGTAAAFKVNGWTLRAKCEHGDQGNIVSSIGLKPVDPAWYKAPARCDHCKTNRFRSITYFVENESGEVRQVGRGCLHEYTGINPATAALWADIRGAINDDFDLPSAEWRARGYDLMYDVPTVLAHTYDAIKEFGYRKSDECSSTKDEVFTRVLSGKKPSPEAIDQASKINLRSTAFPL